MAYNEGITTFTADVDLDQGVRVKIKSGTTAAPPEVEAAGAADASIGVVDAHAKADELVTIRLNSQSGTRMCVAAGAFAVGADVFGAANGQVDAAGSLLYGVAKEAAVAAGDIVEIVPQVTAG